jgi:hypothetical protein
MVENNDNTDPAQDVQSRPRGERLPSNPIVHRTKAIAMRLSAKCVPHQVVQRSSHKIVIAQCESRRPACAENIDCRSSLALRHPWLPDRP